MIYLHNILQYACNSWLMHMGQLLHKYYIYRQYRIAVQTYYIVGI